MHRTIAAGRRSGRLPLLLIALSIASLGSVPAAAVVEGRVTTAEGKPIEGARVRLLGETEASAAPGGAALLAVTDRQGTFAFPSADPPARLRIEHPRFETLSAEVAAAGVADLVLEVKQEIFDQIVVTAGRERGGGVQPVSVATTSVAPLERPAPATTLVELLEGAPGVAENGQGGLFQAYSIRGVAGWRIQTLVAGARIVTERRAGATASFVDPLLFSDVDVVRGPYTSYYGSGALGGVMQALPAHFRDPVVHMGYESQGDAAYQRVGLGGGSWSLGIAHRASDDAETADGTLLFSQFDQWSAALMKDFEFASGLEAEFLVLPTIGRDIGKPNARFPERITSYPEEHHLITRFTLRRPGTWRLDLFAHPNELETLNLRSDQRSVVQNEAFDVGASLQRELDLPRQWAAQVGMDYFARRGVEGSERIELFETGEITEVTTLDGMEDEVAAYGSLRRGFGRVNLEVGTRLTWLGQDNAGAAATDDTAWAGFAGATAPLGAGFEVATNLATGLRFPGLSERYFTGSTGRGEVIAAPDLEPERSVSGDLGLRWYGDRVFAAAYVFRNEIEDYIEEVELDTGVNTFENLTAGTIEGFEIEGFVQATEELRLTWGGQRVQGRSDEDAALADIPADRVQAGLHWQADAWHAGGLWQHRLDKDDPGPGEQRTEAAEVVSATVGYRWDNGLGLAVTGSNLLDEDYLPSADELSVPAEGRSVGVGVSWTG